MYLPVHPRSADRFFHGAANIFGKRAYGGYPKEPMPCCVETRNGNLCVHFGAWGTHQGIPGCRVFIDELIIASRKTQKNFTVPGRVIYNTAFASANQMPGLLLKSERTHAFFVQPFRNYFFTCRPIHPFTN